MMISFHPCKGGFLATAFPHATTPLSCLCCAARRGFCKSCSPHIFVGFWGEKTCGERKKDEDAPRRRDDV